MFSKSQPLAAFALFALAAQAQEIPDFTQARTLLPQAPANTVNFWELNCITNKQIKGIQVQTKACEKSIEKLLDDQRFITPPSDGCAQLVNEDGCSIGICGNEAIQASVIGVAAQKIHAECKPIGSRKKHIVAGTIMTKDFNHADGSRSGPARIIMGSVKGLQSRSVDDAPDSPTAVRLHAKDLHAPTRTLDRRAGNDAQFPVPSGGDLGLRFVVQQSPQEPLTSPTAQEQALAQDLVQNWGNRRNQVGATSVSGQDTGGTRGMVVDDRIVANLEYEAFQGHDLSDIPPARRNALAAAFLEYRRQHGNPRFFVTLVFRGAERIGVMLMRVGPRAPGSQPWPPM
jgi:hypothetical protein